VVEVSLVPLVLVYFLDSGHLLPGLRDIQVGEPVDVLLPDDLHLLLLPGRCLLALPLLLRTDAPLALLALLLALPVLLDLPDFQVTFDEGLAEFVFGDRLGQQLRDAFGQEFAV